MYGPCERCPKGARHVPLQTVTVGLFRVRAGITRHAAFCSGVAVFIIAGTAIT